MEYYMNDIFQLTMESMNCGSDEIALQVIIDFFLEFEFYLFFRPSNFGQPYAMKKLTWFWRKLRLPSKNVHPRTFQGLFCLIPVVFPVRVIYHFF